MSPPDALEYRGVTVRRFRSGRWCFLTPLPRDRGVRTWWQAFTPTERALLDPGSRAPEAEQVAAIQSMLDRFLP